MKNKPLVSILIPVFNGEKYLGEAIDSALAQSYKNIEIVIHNDASTDNTPKVLDKYRKFKKIRIITTRNNHGMVEGWNYIAKFARGECIKFLAADDLIDKNCVSELVQALARSDNPAVVTCARRFVSGSGKLLQTMKFAAQTCVVNGRRYSRELLETLRENKIGEPTAVLYPKSLIKKAGGYDSQFTQFSDFEYWIRLCEFGDIIYIDKPLCSFRVHEGSSTSSAIRSGKFIRETYSIIHKYYDSPHFTSVFSLTKRGRRKVFISKTLDILKNIKDLCVAGKLHQAGRYTIQLIGGLSS